MASCARILQPLLLLLIFVASAIASSPSEQIRVLSAERRIDLTSFIVRVYLTLKVENIGANDVSQVLLAYSPSEAEHIADLKASKVEGKRKKKTLVPLYVAPSDRSSAPNGATLFGISLPNPLKAGETAILEVLYIITHCLEPFPLEISQSEAQLVYYRDSAKVLSPYNIAEQTTYIKVPTSRVESFTIVDPSARAGTELKYGTYYDQPPYSYSPIVVHFENNRPFAVVEELERKIEISHWGNLQITEYYKLKHSGARHKGVFSRLEYQSRPSFAGMSSFRHLLARLPPRVHSVYYRDEIGNISSSHLRVDSRKSELELEPRYPLFGGWRASFIIGYGLPLQDFLFQSADGKRFINFSFGCPLQETVVDELMVKVVLPEGSQNPSAVVPFDVGQHFETSYSFIDVVGRTTLVLKKKNVVAEHNIPFQVQYEFSPVSMLVEPLILVSAYLLLFVACIAYFHMDLSIKKA